METELLEQWLKDKFAHREGSLRESATATVEWKKNTGGMIMRAGITVTLNPSVEFTISVLEDGIESGYVSGAINGVLTELVGKPMYAMSDIEVVISDFQIDEVGSSYVAFYRASAEATRQCLAFDRSSPSRENAI